MTGRRALLSGAAAFAFGASLPRVSRAQQDVPVAVIGAGIAGLNAARTLVRAGHRVVVFEANDRIGGRLKTSHVWPDLPIDLGASWIHGMRGNPLVPLARAAGARLVPQAGSLAVGDRTRFPHPQLVPLISRARETVERARDAWQHDDAPLSEVVAAYLDATVAPGDLRAAVDAYLSAEIEQEYAADARDLSAWWFDDADALRGPDALLPGGYDRLAHHLGRGLDIRLNQPVRAVLDQPRGVRLQLSSGPDVICRAVIVTAPLGVLKAGDIRFDPPLSGRHQQAIDRLGMGLLNKVVLRFERAFWPPDVDWIGLMGERFDSWASLVSATGVPVLMGFQAGRAAEHLEALTDARVAALALQDLRAVFGSTGPAQAQVTRWRQNPWSRGSYSTLPPGASPQDRAALAQPDWAGRLIFAGEAASTDHPSTVHGAFGSGAHAAQMIL